jgi:hypothetical protein
LQCCTINDKISGLIDISVVRKDISIVPKLNRQSLRSAIRVSRVLLGSALLLSILSLHIPTALVASGPMCKLACCAGRAPHAAGSCMNGSCHASLSGHTEKIHIDRETPIEQAEELCGLARLKANPIRIPLSEKLTIGFGLGASSDDSREASKSAADQAGMSTQALTKPCQPDCGSCASGFAGSNRQRNTAALAYADRPRPPSGVGFGNTTYRPTQPLSALCSRGAPRGPPLSFS